jgi:hypothetical protein
MLRGGQEDAGQEYLVKQPAIIFLSPHFLVEVLHSGGPLRYIWQCVETGDGKEDEG